MHLNTVILSAFALVMAPAMAQAPPPAPAAARIPTMGAIGLGVTDMVKSAKFYTEVLGLVDTKQRFSTPQFDEIVLTMPGKGAGSAVVLMQYKQPRNVTNLPIKLVFYVADVKAQVEKIRKAGMRITLEPGTGVVGNVTIPTAFGTDPDGYMLELNPLSLLSRA
jgi:catechol 2,3-dioxygenase-like lactoylglutathione lyase family enzyme